MLILILVLACPVLVNITGKNPLIIGVNSDHVTLGLGLGLRSTFHVIPGRTVLRSGEGRVIPRDTRYTQVLRALYSVPFQLLYIGVFWEQTHRLTTAELRMGRGGGSPFCMCMRAEVDPTPFLGSTP